MFDVDTVVDDGDNARRAPQGQITFAVLGAAARQDVAGRQELLQAFVVAEPEGVAFFVRVRRKRRLGKVLVFGDAGGLARVRALGLYGLLAGLLLVVLAHCSWQIGAQWRVESMCLKGLLKPKRRGRFLS